MLTTDNIHPGQMFLLKEGTTLFVNDKIDTNVIQTELSQATRSENENPSGELSHRRPIEVITVEDDVIRVKGYQSTGTLVGYHAEIILHKSLLEFFEEYQETAN